MLKTHMTACLLAFALLAVPAIAQTTGASSTPTGTTTQPVPAPGAAAGTSGTAAGGSGAGTVTASGMGASINFITRRDQGIMRASELIGKDVYGANNEDIGEVDDVLINRSGQVAGVVVGVGGFLGIGETNVAVPLNALQFRPRDATRGAGAGTAATTTGAAGTGGTPSTTGAAGTAGTGTAGAAGTSSTTAAGTGTADADVIVLMVTKEQLNSAPKFQDDARGRATTGGATTGTGTSAAPGTVPGAAPRQ